MIGLRMLLYPEATLPAPRIWSSGGTGIDKPQLSLDQPAVRLIKSSGG